MCPHPMSLLVTLILLHILILFVVLKSAKKLCLTPKRNIHRQGIAGDVFTAIQPLKVIFQEKNLYQYRFESAPQRVLDDLEDLLPSDEVINSLVSDEDSSNSFDIVEATDYAQCMGKTEPECFEMISFEDDEKKNGMQTASLLI